MSGKIHDTRIDPNKSTAPKGKGKCRKSNQNPKWQNIKIASGANSPGTLEAVFSIYLQNLESGFRCWWLLSRHSLVDYSSSICLTNWSWSVHRSVPFYFNWTPSRGCYGTPVGGKKVNIEIFSVVTNIKLKSNFRSLMTILIGKRY